MLEFSHRREHLIDTYLPKCRKLVNRFLKTGDAKLEKHYFYLAMLFKGCLTVCSRSSTIETIDAQASVRVASLYFVYAKTLSEALLSVARYTGQSGGFDLLGDEDLYVLVIKVFEGYSYNPYILRNLYIALSNLSTNEAFLQRLAKMKVFHYALIHGNAHTTNIELLLVIFRFVKNLLRNGQMIELFYEACSELQSSMDLTISQLIVRVASESGQKYPPSLVELLTLAGMGCRNNRKFEVGLLSDKSFVGMIAQIANDHGSDLSEDLVNALASLPIEDIISI